jgi:hypothetical protein
VRQESGIWVLHEAIGLAQQLDHRAIDCTLHLADVCEKVELAPVEGGLPRDDTA